MRETEVRVQSAVDIAAVLCLPETASRDTPVAAIALIAGSGADTRDGDLVLEAYHGVQATQAGHGVQATQAGHGVQATQAGHGVQATQAGHGALPPAPGTIRRIAHHLAHHGVASLRWDRRGFGASGGDPADVGYHTDLEDAIACYRWLQARPEVERSRVGVAGHSAGALVACRVCRDVPYVAGAGLLGALASPIEDMLRWNVGRVPRHWDEFSDDQREWLVANMPKSLVRSEGMETLLAGAARGDASVTLTGHGVTVTTPTTRLRQDLATDYAAEMRAVTCPALVLHGGDDLNVPVADARHTYSVLREEGNDDVELRILPGLEHYFNPVSPNPADRIWDRVTQASMLPPMAAEALDAISAWAVRTL